jgi:hypothetical protein
VDVDLKNSADPGDVTDCLSAHSEFRECTRVFGEISMSVSVSVQFLNGICVCECSEYVYSACLQLEFPPLVLAVASPSTLWICKTLSRRSRTAERGSYQNG